MADLFVESPTATPKIVATYPYVDENGALLFEVVRYEPKGFSQRRPDGNGGWLWNLDGVRRVPYNLPEVIKARTILICEGEKDCLTARASGLVATTNAGGAGKWRTEYADWLRGILLVYHLGKGERADAPDAILGSTAFFAAVDTALIMKRSDLYRTLHSRQRYGADLPETILDFEPVSRKVWKFRLRDDSVCELMLLPEESPDEEDGGFMGRPTTRPN